MQANHEAALDTLTQRHALELDQVSKQLEELMRKHAVEREATGNERAVFAQEKEKVNEILRSKESEHSSITNQLKADHSSEVSRLKEAHTAESEQLARNHSEELDKATKSHSAELAALKEAHATELNELKQQHTSKLNEVESKLKDAYSTFTTSESEKQTEVDSKINDLSNQLSALKSTYQNTTDDLKRSNDLVTASKQTILELNTKVQDLELKLVGTAQNESTAVTKMNEEMTKLRAALNGSQEKLTVLEHKNVLQIRMHRRNSEEREKELMTERGENVVLRNRLKVRISRISFTIGH